MWRKRRSRLRSQLALRARFCSQRVSGDQPALVSWFGSCLFGGRKEGKRNRVFLICFVSLVDISHPFFSEEYRLRVEIRTKYLQALARSLVVVGPRTCSSYLGFRCASVFRFFRSSKAHDSAVVPVRM